MLPPFKVPKQVNCWQQCENAMMEHLKVKSAFFSYCFRSKHPKDWFHCQILEQERKSASNCIVLMENNQLASMEFLQVKEIQKLNPYQSGTISLPAKFWATAGKKVVWKYMGLPYLWTDTFLVCSQSRVKFFLPFGLSSICESFQMCSLSKYLTSAYKSNPF